MTKEKPKEAADEQPGPTDVTMEEVLAETTDQLAATNQQLTIARLKVVKQETLIKQLQEELVKKSANA